jgi:hypothetical protein
MEKFCDAVAKTKLSSCVPKCDLASDQLINIKGGYVCYLMTLLIADVIYRWQ